jgi:hypothetical protein
MDNRMACSAVVAERPSPLGRDGCECVGTGESRRAAAAALRVARDLCPPKAGPNGTSMRVVYGGTLARSRSVNYPANPLTKRGVFVTYDTVLQW